MFNLTFSSFTLEKVKTKKKKKGKKTLSNQGLIITSQNACDKPSSICMWLCKKKMSKKGKHIVSTKVLSKLLKSKLLFPCYCGALMCGCLLTKEFPFLPVVSIHNIQPPCDWFVPSGIFPSMQYLQFSIY